MTPWAKSLGISGGTSSRMLNNEPPGTDILTMIMRTEHVNLSWLLGGHGTPFMLDHYTSAEEFENMLRIHAQDAHYDAWLCLNFERNQMAVVLSEPATFTFKNKTIEYSHVEMLTGPIPFAIAEIDKMLSGCNVRYFSMNELDFTAYTRGQYGTYKMLGSEDKKGIIQKNEKTEGVDFAFQSDKGLIIGEMKQGKSSVSFSAMAEKIKAFTAKQKTDVIYLMLDVAAEHDLQSKLDKETKLETLAMLEESGKTPDQLTKDDIHFALLANIN
ncbi:hypothetical protein DS731_07405 [Alteromonas sp. RKMC-009]|nr:hypothetical protein DS731_07405 [Alteromonas sp. RKMC-009]